MKKKLRFCEAIEKSTVEVLKSSKRNLLFGLEVTNEGTPYVKSRKKQFFETTVSEL